MATLKEKYEAVCNDYIAAFKEKNEFLDIEIIDENGGNYDCDGYIFSFRDIRTDVDNNVPKTFCREYNDHAYEQYATIKSCMNYANWLRFTKKIQIL